MNEYSYRPSTWNPIKQEELLCEKEDDTPYDIFALKVMDSRGQIVGLLQKEISRSSYFLILRGAPLNCIVTD